MKPGGRGQKPDVRGQTLEIRDRKSETFRISNRGLKAAIRQSAIPILKSAFRLSILRFLVFWLPS